MPPTVAAAMITTSGRWAFIQSSTCCWRRRSTSARAAVSVVQPSRASRRTIALPTMPRWPATKTRRPASLKTSVFVAPALMLVAHGHQIGRHHLGDQRAKACLVGPAELAARLGRVALQEIHLGRAQIARIDGDQHLAALRIHTLLLGSRTPPGDLAPDFGKGELDKFAHR